MIFANAGRFVVCDQGAVTMIFRIISKVGNRSARVELSSWLASRAPKIVDAVVLTELANRFAHTSADFTKLDKRKKH